MAGVYTYSGADVNVIAGSIPLTGLVSVSVTRDNDAYTKFVSLDGAHSRARSSDRGGKIVVELTQTSPSNDTMTAIMLLDEASDSGVVPVLVKDATGRSLHFAETAWILKKADESFQKDIQTRSWTFDCSAINSFVGGNTEQRGANL